MPNLSPAAQAVLDAYRSIWADEPLESDVECLAAALRAAADLIKPDINRTPWLTNEYGYFNETFENVEALGELNAHYRLLAIADKLEETLP